MVYLLSHAQALSNHTPTLLAFETELRTLVCPTQLDAAYATVQAPNCALQHTDRRIDPFGS